MCKEKTEMIEIRYQPNWFQSGYYVYCLIINHKQTGSQFYYIGQTGDRKHVSARSPFYRMSGHFNTYGRKNISTDSQLVGGLINKRLIEQPSDKKHTRVCVEEAVSSGNIRIVARFLKIYDFDGQNHTDKRRFTEAVEQSVISLFIKTFGSDRVLNKKLRGATKNITKASKEKANEVYNELVSSI